MALYSVPMPDSAAGAAKRLGLEILGWTVLALGVLALFLPGPGLLLTFAGLAILSTQYVWARRLVEPVRIKALRGAAESVETRLRVGISLLIPIVTTGIGVAWVSEPPPPSWWPLDERFWLFGGDVVGYTLIGSSLLAIGLVLYAARRFHHRPDAVRAVDRMEDMHRAKVAVRKEARRRLEALRSRGLAPVRDRAVAAEQREPGSS